MAESPVLYHKYDCIATLTLNRPETLNAMNEAMMAELERQLIGLEADATARGGRFPLAVTRSVSAMLRAHNGFLMATWGVASSSA